MIFRKYIHFLGIAEWVFISVILFLVYIPSANSFIFDQHRIFAIAIILLNLFLSLLSSFFRQSLIQQFFCFPLTVRLLLLSLLLLAACSVILAPLIPYALLETCAYMGLFFLSLTIASLVAKKKYFFQTIFFVTVIISSICYQVAFFAGYLASFIENIPLQWPEPFVGFANIRFFNQYHLGLFFLISLPLLIYPNLANSLRTSLKIIAVGWAILLFVSSSRGEVGAIFLALFICAVLFKKSAYRFIKLNSWILVAGLLGSFSLFNLLPRLLDNNVVSGWKAVEEMTHDSPRLYLWKQALSYIASHPWLGIGPMHYAYYPNIHAHPHNSVLQWTAEMGLPSGIILVYLISWGLLAWVKQFYQAVKIQNSSVEQQTLWIALFATMSAELIYSMVDGVIVMPVSQILMVTIAGWMFGLYFQEKPHLAIPKNANFITLILISMVLGGFLFTLNTFKSNLLLRWQGEEPITTRIHPELMQPRFWQQGQIPD